MFSNAQQSIPELFKEKMRVDNDLNALCSQEVVSPLDVGAFKTLKKRQAELSAACAKWITKAKGP